MRCGCWFAEFHLQMLFNIFQCLMEVTLQLRQPTLAKLTFEDLLKKKINQPVFKLATGETTKNLAGTFRVLMRDSGLDADRDAKHKRTLYSLRHTYAHFALMKDRMSVYTLAEQMGTSVKMIEKHYGHITPALKAQEIAGKRYIKKAEKNSSVDKSSIVKTESSN